MNNLWNRLCQSFNRVPTQWKITDGTETDEAYIHGTSILGLAFSPDDSILALAGGGSLPGLDGSVRLIDVVTKKNVSTLHGHICGVHDVSFHPHTGILASASFDYAVYLWNIEKEDVIYLRGEDYKTKGYSRFTRDGSLLAIGEYDHYEAPHSFYLYDLKSQKKVFEFALPDELGVTSMALSPDSAFLAVTACDQNQTKLSRFYLVNLREFEIVQEHSFENMGFYDLSFVDGCDRLIGGVSGGAFGDYESGLVEIDSQSGKIKWSELLGGIGVTIACHPHLSEIAIAFEGSCIRFYDPNSWKITRQYRFKEDVDPGGVCSLAYSNQGNYIAYGLSTGKFDILDLRCATM